MVTEAPSVPAVFGAFGFVMHSCSRVYLASLSRHSKPTVARPGPVASVGRPHRDACPTTRPKDQRRVLPFPDSEVIPCAAP